MKDKFVAWLESNLVIVVVTIIALALLAFVGHNIASWATSDKPETVAKGPAKVGAASATPMPNTTQSTPVTPEEEIPTSRKILGVVIVIVVIGIFVGGIVRTWEEGVPWYKQSFWYGVMAITIYALIATNMVLAFLLPKLWDLFWQDQILFWSANIGLIALVRFFSITGKDGKPIGAARFAGWIFGIILLVGLIVHVSQNKDWCDKFDDLFKQVASSFGQPGPSTVSPTMGGAAPMEVALAVICKHESGCRQKDSQGNIIKNKQGSSAFGKYQFLESHREPAHKLGFDLNTEAGQDAYAEYLWKEGLRKGESPTKHWEGDPKGSFRWQTELMSLGYNPWGEVEGALEAPVDRWSEPVIIHPGIFINWGETDGKMKIKDQKGDEALYDPKGGLTQNLPYPSKKIQFMSSEEKKVKVKLTFTKK